MLAHFRKHIALISLFVLLLLAMPSSAETFELDFWGYANFTPLNNVNIPGVTFIISPSATITTDGETGIDIFAGPGTDLIIRFSSLMSSVRLTAYGYGSCQQPRDTISLFNDTTQVSSASFAEPPSGRCTTILYQVNALFNEIHFDVDDDEGMEIWNLDVTYADSPTEFTDGRINSQDMGSPVVLYPIDYGDGAMGLHVYAADGSGLLWEIQPGTIPAECPDSNTLIGEDEASGIQLYRLAADTEGNCVFQLVAPTSEAGKFYNIIFDEISENSAYYSWEE
jgi:hypothetical protein